MKKTLFPLIFLFISFAALKAQDEGAAVAQTRFERDKSVYFGGGYSMIFGENIGDYSNGISFEAGFLKRLNKVMSIGPSLSYVSFKYDESVSESYSGGDGNNIFFNDTFDEARVVYMEGGDITMVSLAFNLKFNLIPVGDNTKFTVYGFAKPFIAMSSRTEVSGVGEYWYYDYDYDEWYYDSFYDDEWDSETDGLEDLGADTEITGGIFIGPAIEFMPSAKVSFFAQLSIGYTFPITYVSTISYPPDINEGYLDEKFPLVKEGFPSLSIQAGVSFNF
jgi:hypothetical protein